MTILKEELERRKSRVQLPFLAVARRDCGSRTVNINRKPQIWLPTTSVTNTTIDNQTSVDAASTSVFLCCLHPSPSSMSEPAFSMPAPTPATPSKNIKISLRVHLAWWPYHNDKIPNTTLN
ncbi:hypothetical protein LXL04_035832 [Taraxacum kok-saghyz]